MLTTHRIQEHFDSLEMDRLRAEVQELQTRVTRLEWELRQCRRNPDASATPTAADVSELSAIRAA